MQDNPQSLNDVKENKKKTFRYFKARPLSHVEKCFRRRGPCQI